MVSERILIPGDLLMKTEADGQENSATIRRETETTVGRNKMNKTVAAATGEEAGN